MPIPIAFFGITMILVTFFFKARKSSSTQLEDYDRFLNDEQSANFSRRKDPKPEDFLTIDTGRLPLREYLQEQAYQRAADKQSSALALAREPMLLLGRGFDNRELKLKYGAANLDMIITSEENYNRFIHSLLEWAAALVTLGEKSDAAMILEYAIELHCDRSQAYTMLADIFAEGGERDKLSDLRSRLLACDTLYGSAKDRALKHIDSL